MDINLNTRNAGRMFSPAEMFPGRKILKSPLTESKATRRAKRAFNVPEARHTNPAEDVVTTEAVTRGERS